MGDAQEVSVKLVKKTVAVLAALAFSIVWLVVAGLVVFSGLLAMIAGAVAGAPFLGLAVCIAHAALLFRFKERWERFEDDVCDGVYEWVGDVFQPE